MGGEAMLEAWLGLKLVLLPGQICITELEYILGARFGLQLDSLVQAESIFAGERSLETIGELREVPRSIVFVVHVPLSMPLRRWE